MKILVLGATGFLGGHLARKLLTEGFSVRCLVRNPAKAKDMASGGCEIVQGDMTDAPSVLSALAGIDAVYVCTHTLSPQQGDAARQDFMDVEAGAMRNIVTAAKAHGARRLIYVTSLGIERDSPSAWLRGRWRIEQDPIGSGLDVTVLHPGQIVGAGGRGFETMVSNARRSVVFGLGGGRQRMRNIALDDLLYYLAGVLGEPRAFGQRFDVGSDDVPTNNEMIDIAAELLGRRHPIKIQIPRPILLALAPLLDRAAKMPPGALRSYLDAMGVDGIGDPMPIRAILPRPPIPYREAVKRALASGARN